GFPPPRLRLLAARAAIAREPVWPLAWAPLGTLGLFFAPALSDVLTALPGLAHACVLAALFCIFLFFVVRAVLRFHWPSAEAARRRLELASGIEHRPLETPQDRPPQRIVSHV